MTTVHMEIINNQFPVLIPNEILEADGFYMSYNDYDIDIYASSTTALVVGQMEHFYILNGDHREQYAKLISQGFKACLDYFNTHLDQKNKYSESLS